MRLARDGAAREAVQRYDDAGRIQLGADAGELRQRLVADWWAQRDPDGSLMIAQRRVDVADLNGRAHALMRASGALGAEEMRVGGADLSVGDRIVLRRNDRRLGVVNGDRGVVVALLSDEGRIDVQIGGRSVSLTREAAYVALSRGRESNRIYALEPATADRGEYAPTATREKGARATLVDALGRSGAQTLASDVGRPARLMAALAEVRRERIELADNREGARDEVRRLARHRPPRYRPGLRAEYAAANARAAATLEQIDRAMLALDSRETQLRQQLARERAMAEPERGRTMTTREAGRGMELGL